MANHFQIQLQSPFSDVCWLHVTLTNKGFQNGCWPMEDMVRIWSAMADRLIVATTQRTWGDVPFLGCKFFAIFKSSVRTKQVLRKRSLQGSTQ